MSLPVIDSKCSGITFASGLCRINSVPDFGIAPQDAQVINRGLNTLYKLL